MRKVENLKHSNEHDSCPGIEIPHNTNKYLREENCFQPRQHGKAERTITTTMTMFIITVRSLNEQAIQTTSHLHYVFYTEHKELVVYILIHKRSIEAE